MIACFTGAILVFEEELQHSLHHERYYVKEQKEVQLPITVVTATLKQQLPEAKIGGVKIYSDPSRTLEYSVSLPAVKKANEQVEQIVEEEKQLKKSLQNKKKGNLITSIYSRGLITRNIKLSITNIGKNIITIIFKNLLVNSFLQ
jgi:hypothetical protein